MDIPFSKQQPEPCLKEQCRSVLACYAFGYCRERNEGKQPTVREIAKCRDLAIILSGHKITIPSDVHLFTGHDLDAVGHRYRVDRIADPLESDDAYRVRIVAEIGRQATLFHSNGNRKYSQTGMLLDPNGNRSIFDDVDE